MPKRMDAELGVIHVTIALLARIYIVQTFTGEEMNQLLKFGGIALVVFVMAGCSDPKIDASSDDAMIESTQKVRDSLSGLRKEEFDEALQVLAFSQIDMKDIFAEGVVGPGNLESKMRDALDGKTAEQVIAAAGQITSERQARERAQALEEIRELEEKKENSMRAREELKKFEVLRSRFYMRERDFMGKEPIIELTVRNGTNSPVARAYFEGTIASPNRSVPWLKDTFNYSISGGLEPGEEVTWNLAPNMFSDWGKVDAPADAVFTVTVEKLDGPDGETLYSVREFGAREVERLSELKSQYGIE